MNKYVLGIFIFVLGLGSGSLLNRLTQKPTTIFAGVSLTTTIWLASASYLVACTSALDAHNTPGDQYVICLKRANAYLKDNIYSILSQVP